ncbi:hypothetical protein [Tateyamaria sp.]|uniref:hypothetical protein n=1 Tax=Tateyamaria sp. TaxID=1929288 RepID=UPI003B21A501
MTRFDVARTQQPKSTAAYGSLRFGPLRYQLKRTIGMLPTPDNSECSRHFWHFGALCISDRLNIGSYGVIWEGQAAALAVYEGCHDWDAMAALDGAMARAVYWGGK